MEKAFKYGKTSATGGFHLFLGTSLSTIIMAVGTVILVRLMTPEDYGLYSIALMPSLMVNLFRDWGTGSAMTKYIAQYRASNDVQNLNNVVSAVLTFQVMTGLVLSLVSFLTADFLALYIFHRPELTALISVVSITVFANSLIGVCQSAFVGFEEMKLNSGTVIVQATVKSVATPLLVYFGFGALGATLGYTLSFLAGGIVGLALLYFLVLVSIRRRVKTNKPDTRATLRTMLLFGVPLSVSSILQGFVGQFYGFMMAIYCSNVMIGNFQSATQFSVILTFFSVPISTVLFPVFAKVDLHTEPDLVRTVFSSSIKYTAILLVPTTMAMMVLSKPIIGTLFGDKWLYATFFLALNVIGNLLCTIGSLSIGAFLIGIGETKTLLKLGLLVLLVGIPLAFVLIPLYGIVGVILGNTLAGSAGVFWTLWWVWKHYKMKPDFTSSIRILVASAFAAIVTYLLLNSSNFADLINLVIGGATFLAAYVILGPALGAITSEDIHNLREMLSGLGIVSRIINIPLILAEKVANHAASLRFGRTEKHTSESQTDSNL
jgi:O-antigen/teichoic acid export membrane protein